MGPNLQYFTCAMGTPFDSDACDPITQTHNNGLGSLMFYQ